jgi:hypothetical protein
MPKTATPIASAQARWPRASLAETGASDRASAACYRSGEDIGIVPVVVAELELGDVQGHVLLADLMEGPDDAALEDRPEAFNGLSVNRADDVFARGVLDDLVGIELFDVPVAGPFVGAKQADFFGNRFQHKLGQYLGTYRVNHPRDNVTLTLDRADDWRFAGTDAATAASAASAVLVVRLAPDESFVDFDDTKKLLEFLVLKRRTNAVAHIPSGFVAAEAHVAMDLTCADALLAGEHQVDDLEPLAEIDLRVFEYRSDKVGKAVGAALSTIRAFPFVFHRAELIDALTLTARATNANRPAMSDQVAVARGFIGKGGFPLLDRHLMYLARLLGAGHDSVPQLIGAH